MIRAAARFAAGWLPESVRAQLARRRFGYAGAAAAFQITRTIQSDGTIAVAIADGPAFLMPPGIEPDFAFHFVENAESRNEMASFIRLSRGAPAGAVLLDVGAHKGLSMGYRFESTAGHPVPVWRLRRSLMAIVRVVAR